MKKDKPGKAKPPAIAPLKIDTTDKRAARNVEKLKNRLSSAMDDPHMREQIMRAMRQLINEDKT